MSPHPPYPVCPSMIFAYIGLCACIYIHPLQLFLLGALCCLLFISDICFQNNSDYYIAHKRKRIRLFLYNSSIREFSFQFDFGPAIMFRCRLIHLYSSAHCFAKKRRRKKEKTRLCLCTFFDVYTCCRYIIRWVFMSDYYYFASDPTLIKTHTHTHTKYYSCSIQKTETSLFFHFHNVALI